MRRFEWDEDKNRWLKEERGVSFGQIVFSIANGNLLDVIRHPNQAKYHGQRECVVEVDNYAYLVPCVEEKELIFLKALFPGRKYTQRYLRSGQK
jgi:uncharacterized DUF497 family protein